MTDTVIPDTSFALPPLQPLTEYWWEVASIGMTGQGPFTPSRRFTTLLGPPPPELIFPPDRATGVDGAPVLVWNRVDPATGYHLIVSLDSLSTSVVNDTLTPDTSCALPPLQPLTEYWWKVASIGMTGQGPFSPSWRFTTLEWLSADDSNIPREFSLSQNYPNPFNPSTTIRYGLPQRSHVTLTVVNTLGQQVANLAQGEQEIGYHAVRFDATALASGVYLYRLQAGDFVQTKKLVVVK